MTSPAPRIDYLTKDFSSFRRMMLDRLSVLLPAWSERHTSDLSIALVDILAYAADYLSYDQDAVATEAYLGTARRRISARRHARLLDYFMHDGANARVFVEVRAASGVTPGGAPQLPAGTALLTRTPQQPAVMSPSAELPAASSAAQVFETMHPLFLYGSHSQIALASAQPVGATSAALVDTSPSLSTTFMPGDLLLFEEILGPRSGLSKDADPTHRQVVRLLSIVASAGVATVTWGAGDALAFRLGPAACVARGNIVLADHGQTLPPENLPPVVPGAPYRPVLSRLPLTQQGHVVTAQGALVAFDPQAPASTVFGYQLADVRPAIQLVQTGGASIATGWSVQRDLLESGPLATDFVVEVDDAGAAHLRFGDDAVGKGIDPTSQFQANYRIGNGLAGNVGAESIAHAVLSSNPGIVLLRNPLPASGGIDPETVAQVQTNAPQAFQQTQQRAVTRADYVSAALLCPGVQSAVARLRWTGSYLVASVVVQRAGGLAVDRAFQTQVQTFLEPFRLAGLSIEVVPPTLVPIQIGLAIATAPGFLPSAVLASVSAALLGPGPLPNGQPARFAPANLTLGQTIYFSEVLAAAAGVPGVASIDTSSATTVFTAAQRPSDFSLPTAFISLGATQLPQIALTLSIAGSS